MVARAFARDRKRTGVLWFSGQLEIRGRPVSVAVEFPDRQLTRIPRLYLRSRTKEFSEAVAHIECEDRVCYARDEELLLDPLNPKPSVALCMAKMVEALDRIDRYDLSNEIESEFPQHWLGSRVYVDISDANCQRAWLYKLHAREQILLITDTLSPLRRLGYSKREAKDLEKRRSPIFVLTVDTPLTFSRGHRAPTTLDDLLRWLSSVGNNLPNRLLDGVTPNWPSGMQFLLRGPNGSVGARLILPPLLNQSVQRAAFLKRALPRWANEIELERISGSPIDAKFLYQRNMEHRLNLSGKRIALIGLGTIGGFLAKFLAQSGGGIADGQLLFFDNQNVEPGNVGRHFLGPAYIGKNKARGVKEELERNYTDCRINVYDRNVLERVDDLLACDLVIDATGERALSDVLNKEFVDARRHEKSNAAVLFVWLVGNGVAAQCLLVDSIEVGCFRCLRLDETSDERFRLLRPDHTVAVTPATCGEGAYFAYGVGAPAMASGLAIQLCLDWVNGQPSPRFRTIRINREATFEIKDSDITARQRCPACGGA
jgi:molybdopterin/thiamine biosynthesis adenylyltransferase